METIVARICTQQCFRITGDTKMDNLYRDTLRPFWSTMDTETYHEITQCCSPALYRRMASGLKDAVIDSISA